MDAATIALLNLVSIMITLIGAIVGAGFYLEKRANNRMARYPIAAEILKGIDEIDSIDKPRTKFNIAMTRMFDNVEPKYTKYKRLGSPDVYAVHYHDSGHIIKTAQEEKHLEDIREMDSKGKFGYPNRMYNRQIR